MHVRERLQVKQHMPRLVILSAFVAVLVVTLGILSSTVLAQGDAGSGGDGTQTGCQTTGTWTCHGHGWYNYSVDGNPSPLRIRNAPAGEPQNWSEIQTECRANGADRVIAYIILNGGSWFNGTADASDGVIYDYNSTNNPTNYRLDSSDGAGWIDASTAQSYFNQLSASDRQGYTWNSNVAWFCYSSAKQWTVDSSTQVLIKDSGTGRVDRYDSAWSTSDKTAVPGQTIYWKHVLQAKNDTIDKRIYWALKGSGFPSDFNILNESNRSAGSVAANTKFAVLGLFTDRSETSSGYTVYQARASDAGKKLCQHINWEPKAWNSSGTGQSDEVCVTVNYSYSLNPAISLSRSGAIESDSGTMQLYPTMSNTGPSVSESVSWQINLISIQPGGSVNNSAGGNSSANPCAYYTGTGISCGLATITGGPNANSTIFDTDASRGGTPHTYTTRNFAIGSYPAGTRLCFALSVDPRSSAANAAWRHSPLACVVVGKQPKVQFWGSDVYAGRYVSTLSGTVSGTAIIRTSSTSNSRGTFGSWSEYAAVANGQITRFGTGAAYADSSGTNNETTVCAASALAFINTPSGTSCSNTNVIGNYGSLLVADTSTSFPAESGRTLSGNVDLASASIEGGHVYTATGNITLSTAVIPQGKWIVIDASNYNIVIGGNITYADGPFTSLSEIPQVVLIGRNISINDTVGRVDSWLIAKGTNVTTNGVINTCNGKTAASRLTVNDCNQQLIVNGPVVANRLLLLRTFGAESGVAAGTPAEIFNLRPDAYIWGYDRANSTQRANTVYLREAPPRL